MSNRFPRFLIRLAGATALLVLGSGAGHALANPGTGGNAFTALVQDVAVERSGEASIPHDFASVMGYEPQLEDGRYVRPDGKCSLPLPGGAGPFEPACRAHDLGYDLLRYGERTGHGSDPGLRAAIDRRFHLDMLHTCDRSRCRALAHVFTLGVALNSIRQGYAPPTLEPALPWAIAGLAMVGLATSTSIGPQSRYVAS